MGNPRQYCEPVEAPRKPAPKKRREPWVCGEWCHGCRYSLRASILGWTCNYYYDTGHLRPEGEDTRACSVREDSARRRPQRTTKEDMAGAFGNYGDGFITYNQIAQVVGSNRHRVRCWNGAGGKQLVPGRKIIGRMELQFTVEEAIYMAKGHDRIRLTSRTNLRTEEQRMLWDALAGEVSKG